MRTKFAALAFGIAALLLLLSPAPAKANSISETFTITVSSPQTLGSILDVTSSSFAQFNPSLGTLTEVQSTLTGTGTWAGTGTVFITNLLTASPVNEVISNSQTFFTLGAITFSISGADSFPFDLSVFSGTGTTDVRLSLNSDRSTDTFMTDGTLTGTITYDYTPAATREPSSLALLATGLLGFAFFIRRHA
jgi:hypothetical protein